VVVLKHGITKVSSEVEIFAIPLTSNANQQDVFDSANDLPPKESDIRILAMHGAVDNMNQNPESIKYETLKKIVESGLADYIALGDRHSTTNVEKPGYFSSEMQGRIFYSGSPEPTDFREENQRNILKVTVGEDIPRVEAIELGRWHFIELGADNPLEFNSKDDVRTFFEDWVSKSGKTKVIRLNCKTHLGTDDYIEFRSILQTLHTDYFGEFTEHKDNPPNKEPITLEQADENPLGLQGYLLDAYRSLRHDLNIEDSLKQEALMLFHRIARDNEN
jgi:DNA repair exonuclease SbcCD nuclease subunit